MGSRKLSTRIGLVLGGAAIVGMTALTAGCGQDKDKPAETPEPTKTSGAPAPTSGANVSPTEKAPTLQPGGPNSFTPSVKARPAPTALPGNVITGG